jgi:hypothetical protein
MSTALMDAPAALFAGGRRATLEELLEVTWRAAHGEGEADCPLCHATMHLGDDEARCSGCGTRLF